jgi:hypothetical protein
VVRLTPIVLGRHFGTALLCTSKTEPDRLRVVSDDV